MHHRSHKRIPVVATGGMLISAARVATSGQNPIGLVKAKAGANTIIGALEANATDLSNYYPAAAGIAISYVAGKMGVNSKLPVRL